MALNLGELAVELDARTAEFRSGLREARRDVDRLEKDVNKGTAGISSSFGKLGAGVGALVVGLGALTAAAASFLALKFGRGAIEAAAEYETLGVTLQTLTGSAEGAKKVLSDVDTLVTQTPFGLQELGGAAKSVAVTFGENTDAVTEFTARVADVAAGLGADIGQFGENFTRAMSAGLGAADLFREKGLSKIILDITGMKDVADVGSAELVKAFRALTSEGGKFFGAAEAQSKTLAGAMSNSQIAVDNFTRTFGQIIQPEVTGFLLDIFQPAVKALEQTLKDNRDVIAGFAARSIPAMINALKTTVGIVADVIRAFSFLSKVWQGIVLVGKIVEGAINAIFVNFQVLAAGVRRGAQAISIGFRLVKAAATGDLGEVRRLLQENRDSTIEWKESVRESLGAIAASNEDIVVQFNKVGEAGGIFEDLADGLEKGAKVAFDLADGLGEVGKAAEEAGKKVKNANVDEILGGKEGGVGASQNLAVPSAEEFGAIEDAMRRLTGEPLKEFATTFADTVSGSMEDGLSGVMEDLKGKAGELFSELGGAIAEQVGGGAIGAGIQSAFQIGGGLLADALSSGDTFSKAAGNISSAVQSAQATRGIVAGPTSVGIAQVERGIGQAFEGSERELKLHTTLLQAIANAVAGTPSATVASGRLDPLAVAGATTGPSLT